jgi:hypothetical protein
MSPPTSPPTWCSHQPAHIVDVRQLDFTDLALTFRANRTPGMAETNETSLGGLPAGIGRAVSWRAGSGHGDDPGGQQRAVSDVQQSDGAVRLAPPVGRRPGVEDPLAVFGVVERDV